MAQTPPNFTQYRKSHAKNSDHSNASKLPPDFELGFHQYLNFGKFKPPKGQRRTYYDLANMGEYGYLKWCLKQCTLKRPQIRIRKECHPHIEAALQNENGQSLWTPKNISEGRTLFKVYTAFNQAGQEVSGPRIEYRLCRVCNQVRGFYMFTQETIICDTCLKSPETSQAPPKHPVNPLNMPLLEKPKLESVPESVDMEPLKNPWSLEEEQALERQLRLRKLMREDK